MLKTKPTRLLIHVCLLVAFYACTTKNEVPQPVVDYARVDALRTELMLLQQKVLGAQQTTSDDSLTLTQMQAEIAKLKAYLSKTVSYTVTVSSYLFSPLSGATVKLSQGGKIVSATTTSSGSVTFNNLYAGIVTATVDLNGFARLVFRADIRDTYDGASSYSTNSQVLMIPLGGTPKADSCMTTQYWKLYANYNMIDDTLGGPAVQSAYSSYFNPSPASNPLLALPAGPDVNNPYISYTAVTTQPITVSLNQYSFIDGNGGGYQSYAVPIGFTGWDGNSTGNGQVVNVTYENTVWTATAGANGIYTVKLPASDISNVTTYTNSASVFAFVLDFGEFTHDYTQYTDPRLPHIINSSSPLTPTYVSTYIYRIGSVGGYRWTSLQTTSQTAAWPFFFYGTLK